MTERNNGLRHGGIRGEHEELLHRLSSGDRDDGPITYVGPGEAGKVELFVDIPALSLNHNEATEIADLARLLEDPKKPWRRPATETKTNLPDTAKRNR